MPVTAVFFDLDGTLLPMEQEEFVKAYFGTIGKFMAPHGWEPKKLLDTIWNSTGAMMKNDGSRTNEDVFWDWFCSVYGPDARSAEPLFRQYYATTFDQVRAACGFEPEAAATVRRLKELGFRLVLATNPLFPADCTHRRLAWTGLRVEDFELVTVYENSCFSKPNPMYFREILDKLGEQPENCLMVGNDAQEDTCCEKIGMPVFLLTKHLLNKKNIDISAYPQGGFDDLLRFVKEQM